MSCGSCPWGTTCGTDGQCVAQDADRVDVPDVWRSDAGVLRDTGDRGDRGDASRTAVIAGRRCTSTPFDPALRADGFPCDPADVERTRVNPCRGICFPINPVRPTEGLCGSLIDVRTATERCPDGAGFEPRTAAGDHLGVCVFRDCERNDQCAPGLVCVHPESSATGVLTDLPRMCSYPTTRQPLGTAGDGGTPRDAGMD